MTQNECARHYKSGFSMPNMLIFVCTCTYFGVISYQLYTLLGSCVCMDIVGTGASTIKTQVICGKPYVLAVYACISIGSYRIIGTGQFSKTKFLSIGHLMFIIIGYDHVSHYLVKAKLCFIIGDGHIW